MWGIAGVPRDLDEQMRGKQWLSYGRKNNMTLPFVIKLAV